MHFTTSALEFRESRISEVYSHSFSCSSVPNQILAMKSFPAFILPVIMDHAGPMTKHLSIA